MTYILAFITAALTAALIIAQKPARVVKPMDSDGRRWRIIGCEFIDFDEEEIHG